MRSHRLSKLIWILSGVLSFALPSQAQSSAFADRYVKQGVERLVNGDYDNAIFNFDQALESKADFGLAYFYRGKARQAKGDVDGAIDDYERAFKTDSRIIRVATDVAEIYLTRGKWKLEQLELAEAIRDFESAITLRPADAENYFHRGMARLIDSDFEAAVSDFTQCIQLDGKYAKAYLARGVARMHQHDTREARKDFDKCRALKQQPDLMLQMNILEIETKIKERRALRASQNERIALNPSRRSIGPLNR